MIHFKRCPVCKSNQGFALSGHALWLLMFGSWNQNSLWDVLHHVNPRVCVYTRSQFERRRKKMSFSCRVCSFRNTLVLEVELSWEKRKSSDEIISFFWLASLNPDLWSSFSVTVLDFYGPIRNQTIVPSYSPSAYTYTQHLSCLEESPPRRNGTQKF